MRRRVKDYDLQTYRHSVVYRAYSNNILSLLLASCLNVLCGIVKQFSLSYVDFCIDVTNLNGSHATDIVSYGARGADKSSGNDHTRIFL